MSVGETTSIEWTDATWNPIRARSRATGKVGWFCAHASPGCVNCYAENMNRRLGTGVAFKPQLAGEVEVFLDEEMLERPLRWRKPKTIFVCSMTDLFGEFVTDEMIARVYGVMIASVHLCGHTFQVLTKRSERARHLLTAGTFWGEVNAYSSMEVMERVDPLARRSDDARAMLDDYAPDVPPPGIWLGASVEDQRRAGERLPELVQTPAAVRFVSYEPALEAVDFSPWLSRNPLDMASGFLRRGQFSPGLEKLGAIHWLIYGDESGPGARGADEAWARSVRDQCAAAGTAFFLKQRRIGREMVSMPALDGVIHDACPGGHAHG